MVVHVRKYETVKARKIQNYANKFEMDLEEILETNWLRKKF